MGNEHKQQVPEQQQKERQRALCGEGKRRTKRAITAQDFLGHKFLVPHHRHLHVLQYNISLLGLA